MRETVKLGVRLMLFALVAGILLAVVNAITEEPIARNERRWTKAAKPSAMSTSFPAVATAGISPFPWA